MRYFILLLLGVACTKQVSEQIPPVPVTAVRIEPKTIPADFTYVGVGESSHIVQIRARVEGYLESINYKEGSLVEAGDLLFILDQRPFIAKVQMATGEVEQQQAILWNAEQTKARMVPLYKENAVSQRDLDNALADEMAAKANLQSALANLYDAEVNLSFTSIQAPVTALSSEAKYREGALISPGEQNLLTTLYVVDPIWVNFSVPEGDLLKARREVKEGKLQWPDKMAFEIEAILSDGTRVPAEGFIDFTNPALQQSTGTMLIRSVLPNLPTLIYPGQFVRVVVKGAVRPNAIVVPKTAVVQGKSGPFVYVIEGGVAKERLVSLGPWYEDFWVIFEGLKGGDLVIAQGVNKVSDGSVVVITSIGSNPP